MKYLTFDDYISIGGTLTEAEFNRLEYRAERLIDNATQGRIKGTDSIPEAVKRCAFELVLYLAATAESGSAAAVSGFSNDGYSVTYAEQKSAEQQIYGIIYDYLADTDLMYCGVDSAPRGASPGEAPDGYGYLMVKI